MNVLSFVNPWLLWGLALAAAPIVIHLWSRRRHRVVEWAAMEFLLEADRRNRRRLRLENWLLLLLRCLLIALVVLAAARPVWHPRPRVLGATSALSADAGAVEHVILLDDSPSMGVSVGTRTLWEQTLAQLRDQCQRWGQARPADTCTLLLTSHPRQPLWVAQSLAPGRLTDKLVELAATKPSALAARFADALPQVEAALTAPAPAGPQRRVAYVASDFRAVDWGDAALATLTSLGNRADLVQLRVLGPDHPANLAVTALRNLDATPCAGLETHLAATVANYGTAAAENVDVTLQVEGAPDLHHTLPRLEPGASAQAVFPVRFTQSGDYKLQARLAADALPADNVRYHVLTVHPGVEVLLVDGNPTAHDGRGETWFLQRALAPPGSDSSGNRVRVVSDTQFVDMPWETSQAIFCCNLYRCEPALVTRLEAWVRAGGGLVMFLGDQVDANVYNARLYRDGQGLLPAALLEPHGVPRSLAVGDAAQAVAGLRLLDPTHPLLRVFAGAQNPFLRQVKVYRWWRVAPAPTTTTAPATQTDAPTAVLTERVAVPAGLTDLDASPLLVEKTLGRGKVLLVTTSASDDWSNWPGDPSFVVSALEMVRQLARPGATAEDMEAGQPLVYPLDPGRYRVQTRLTDPAHETVLLPATASAQGDEAGNSVIPGTPTNPALKGTASLPDSVSLNGGWAVRLAAVEQVGFYDLELQPLDGPAREHPLAVNGPEREGDLRRADLGELQRHGGARCMVQSDWGDSMQTTIRTDGPGPGGREQWRRVVWLLAALLALEQWLAWSFGKRR